MADGYTVFQSKMAGSEHFVEIE